MRSRLIALKSAVPPHAIDQSDAAARAARLFGSRKDISRLIPIFENTGIERRYSCVPIDWYDNDHGWKERTALYVDNAVRLLETVTQRLLEEAQLGAHDLDAIVVVSTTGIATPSLDALLVERLHLRRDIRRLPVFGLGCAGGVIGLARASEVASARPGSRVLFLVVELCALTFRRHDVSKSNLVAAALFGDGAAGAILSTEDGGRTLGPAGEYTWSDSLDVMGWEIEEDGLKARFAQAIPGLVSGEYRQILTQYLMQNDLRLEDIGAVAAHPGGAKVLDALESALGLQRGGLEESRAILRDYGNMSAATALFVLERMDWRKSPNRILMTALGPGFTAAFLTLEQT